MVVGGTVSKAMAIGRRLRVARAAGQDPVEAIIQAAGGTWLFQGKLSRLAWEDRGGFMWGDYWLQGAGRSQGHTLRIWLKNENEISWLDEQPFVTTPDLLCAVEAHTGQPFTNSALREGLEMVVFGVPVDPVWRTPAGLEVTGPRHFNFDLTYQPMEEVLSALR